MFRDFAHVLFPVPAAFALLSERFADEDAERGLAIARFSVDFELRHVEQFAQGLEVGLAIQQQGARAAQGNFRVECLADGFGWRSFSSSGRTRSRSWNNPSQALRSASDRGNVAGFHVARWTCGGDACGINSTLHPQ
jgi:hypothetical protein